MPRPCPCSRCCRWGLALAPCACPNVPDYEEKYREKMLQQAKVRGLDSIEELKQKIREEEQKAAEQSQKTATKQSDAQPSGKQPTTAPNAAQTAAAKSERPLDRSSNLSANNLPPGVKSLDEIMRTDLLADKASEEVGHIWNQYHATKDTISAAIPASTYKDLLKTASKNPLFVIPLPREEGVEFFFMQFDYHQVYFTSLLEYKTNTINARPYLTLTHYTDLMDSKGVVLMRGELDDKSKMIDTSNAQYLALQMQQFYVTGGEEKRRILEKFNHKPEEFDYNELMEAAQKLD
ncbi:ATP11-domain-containing protein [Linderina pennispora]|uniref:ATP11-domain-containing protein n=1 Tax=Linderina pennispora TaxID=61395 RepID=A0A1Y1W7G4_9FUNG|nr:ATP11-domain-containing protein [Linderina pennispora]ORX69166.1 ATP11-domain-containing protein [Linderina pennispora]